MKHGILGAALAALALALPARMVAQGTPEQAAERYLQTLKAQDWAGNSALMDPVELDSMKAAFLDAAASDTSTAGLRQLFGVASVAEMRGLAPAVIYQRFAQNVIGQREGMPQFLAAATFRVMGHVQEGDTAWVVYRVSAAVPGNAAASQVSLVALRSVAGGGWKVRLNEDVRGIMAGLRAAATRNRAAATARQQAPAGVTPAPAAPPARAGAPPPAPPARPAAPPPARP